MLVSVIDISESINIVRINGQIPHTILANINQIYNWISDLPYTQIPGSIETKTMSLYELPVQSINNLSKKEIISIFCGFNYMSVSEKRNSAAQKFVCGTTYYKQDCFVLFN